MEEVFVPHRLKLWANWKGRHWSIMSMPDMHASDWKYEGSSVNPLGEDAQVRAQQAQPETQPKAAAATSGSFRSSWTQWPGYSRINIGGPMEEVFVPHWHLKLWANWKGRHWSIRSSLGMHASDWKDEGPSKNPLGEDGASSVNRSGEDGASHSSSQWKDYPSPSSSQRKDEADIMHEFVTQTLAPRSARSRSPQVRAQ